MNLQTQTFEPPQCAPPINLVRETPVAIVCNGSTLGVMMASPDNLEDFAVGFAITEGVISDLSELDELEVALHPNGIEVRMWLSRAAGLRVAARQRSMIGPVGCGLCGIDSLAKANRRLPRLPDGGAHFSLAELLAAPNLLRAHQPEYDRTRASHAAGLVFPSRGIIMAREDVGRHNALDKLAGALVCGGSSRSSGAIVMTSRVSTELVQKAVALGVPVFIAVSAATDFAVQLANMANLTLIARGKIFRLRIVFCDRSIYFVAAPKKFKPSNAGYKCTCQLTAEKSEAKQTGGFFDSPAATPEGEAKAADRRQPCARHHPVCGSKEAA